MKNITDEIVQKVQKYLKESKNVLIVTHYNPDGDAIGSSLALYHFLRSKGYNTTVITPNDYPKFLHWLPGNDNIIIYDNNKNLADSKIRDSNLIFFLDFNDLDRVNQMEAVMRETSAKKVLIDHHPEPGDFPDIKISTTQVSSTSELLYELISKLGEEDEIGIEISECLYTGIMTDTGSFSYNSSLPATYYVVSKLIENGIDKDKVYWKVYDNYSIDRMRLLGYCLNQKMKVFPDVGAAYISITEKELEQFNYKPGDSEGFVNYPLSVKGVVFSVIFIEREEHIKISFRSKGMFYVNHFAEKHFNGGGHRNAAGGYSDDTMENTLEKFESLLPKYKEEILKHRI